MKSIILFALVGLVLLSVILSPFFIKVKVGCVSQYGTCPEEITTKLAALNQKSLFSARRGAAGILKNSALISDYSMQYKLPNLLNVNIIIKKPRFAVSDSASGNYGLVDEGGTILAIVPSTSLPVVITTKNLKMGDKVTNEELFALKLILGVYEMYQVRSGNITDGTLSVDIEGGVRVIFPLEGDSDVLLGALRVIYGRTREADLAGKYHEIDLRFKNPVLR